MVVPDDMPVTIIKVRLDMFMAISCPARAAAPNQPAIMALQLKARHSINICPPMGRPTAPSFFISFHLSVFSLKKKKCRHKLLL